MPRRDDSEAAAAKDDAPVVIGRRDGGRRMVDEAADLEDDLVLLREPLELHEVREPLGDRSPEVRADQGPVEVEHRRDFWALRPCFDLADQLANSRRAQSVRPLVARRYGWFNRIPAGGTRVLHPGGGPLT